MAATWTKVNDVLFNECSLVLAIQPIFRPITAKADAFC